MNEDRTSKFDERSKSDDKEMQSAKNTARIAGLLYLSVIGFGVLAQVIRMNLIDYEDTVQTINNISENELLFLTSFLSDLIMLASYAFLGLFAYFLFKKFDERVSMIMLIFVILSAGVAAFNTINQFAAFQLLNGYDYFSLLETDLINAQVMFHLELHSSGTYIAQIMGWGPWLFPLGFMGYKSGFFPRILGVLLMLGSAGLVLEGFRFFLLPELEFISYPGILISMIAEFSACGWLLVKGVRKEPFSIAQTIAKKSPN